MTISTWRLKAKYIIEAVKHDNPDLHGDDLRNELKQHYPFGPRAHHPYKIWLSEVTAHCGKQGSGASGIRNHWVQAKII